jgi:DNA polymerase-3 subunit gamma/tau
VALALYRKYRPASFADVVGQEHVTEPLRVALGAGRVNHAYLFSGPRGCGKTSSARILARSLNCELGPTPDPCGVCPSCIALAPEGPGNIDVIELDAASHGGVDDARELRDRAFYAPAESRYRVFIVDEAHMVTTQGFNALLKIVEEPPEHLVFVFATTEPDKVLATIRSRTHHYPFRLIPPGTLRGLLERICADEGVIVAPPVYPLVIRAGGGSARDSLSILDQLLAGAGPEGVTYERAVALLGVTDVSLIDDAVDALAANDGAAVFEAIDRLVEAGHDPRRFSADLLERLRDLMLIQAVPDAAARGLVNMPADEASRMADQAARLGPAALGRYAEILHTGLTEMRGATAPRLLLELMCGRMLLPAASIADASMLQRLERMERRMEIAPPVRSSVVASGSPAASSERRSARSAERGEPPESPAPAAGERSAEQPRLEGRAVRSARSAEQPVLPSGSASGSAEQAFPAEQPASSGVPVERERSVDRGEPPASPTPADAARSAEHSLPAHSSVAPRSAERSAPDQQEPGGTGNEPAAPREPIAPADPPTAGGMDAAAVRRVWPEILSAAKDASRSTGALLMNAQVKALDAGTLVLTINSAPLARRLSEQRNTDVIGAALRTVLGVDWRVRCDHGDGTSAGGASGGSVRGGTARGGSGGGSYAGGAAAADGGPAGSGYPGGATAGGDFAGADGSAGESSAARSAAARSQAGGGAAGGGAAGSGAAGTGPVGSGAAGGGEAGTGRGGAGSGGAPKYQRPTAKQSARGASSRSSVPLPPEPPPEDEEEMLAEADFDSGDPAAPRRDPEEVAIELLAAQLGARAVDDRR